MESPVRVCHNPIIKEGDMMRKNVIGLILIILLTGLAITSCTPLTQVKAPTHWTFAETDNALGIIFHQMADFETDILKRIQTAEQGMDIRIVNCNTVQKLTNTLPSLMKTIEQNTSPDTKQAVSCYKELHSMFLNELFFAEGLCEKYTRQNELIFIEKQMEMHPLISAQIELCNSYMLQAQERFKEAEKRKK